MGRAEEDEWRERARVSANAITEAWGSFLGRVPWDVMVNLTFDPKRAYRVRQEQADRETWRWCCELGRVFRFPVAWLYATERGRGGGWHAHALVAGVDLSKLQVAIPPWEMRNGRTEVSKVYNGCGAVLYTTKDAADGSEVTVSDTVSRYRDRLRPAEVVRLFGGEKVISDHRAEPVPAGSAPKTFESHNIGRHSGHDVVATSELALAAAKVDPSLDGWLVPPDTADRRKGGRGSGRRTDAMAQQLTELVEQFCNYQRKQRGKTEGGVRTYRWNLEQFLVFVRNRHGRLARVTDLTPPVIQGWMDDMAGADLALGTMRVRQSTLSSFCAWLVKRDVLAANPVAKLERPPHHREPPTQVPGAAIMDALVEAAKARRRPRDLAIFLILRYTGMRRESVATLRVQHLDGTWGLRRVKVKGGKTRDIPLPAAVMTFLQAYVQLTVSRVETVGPETPLFWSTWGRRLVGKTRAPMTGKNIWRLCKVYGRIIGYPELKPHDLRHGVAMEILEQHHDLEQVRALLGHARIDTTQVYTSIRPAQLKRAVSFYEEKALRMLSE